MATDIAVRNIHDWSDHTVSLEEFTKHCRSASRFVAPGGSLTLYLFFITSYERYARDSQVVWKGCRMSGRLG